MSSNSYEQAYIRYWERSNERETIHQCQRTNEQLAFQMMQESLEKYSCLTFLGLSEPPELEIASDSNKSS